MSKIALLTIFLIACISWLYQPYSIDPNDALIDKHRPSLKNQTPSLSKDSIFRVKTHFDNHATAFNAPKAVPLVQYDN